MIESPLRKWLLIFVGILLVGVGTVGIFLPLLPTTPFFLLAAACFIRSSERLYLWLTTHKWFGSYIKNYREHRAMTIRSKVVILLLFWSTLSYTGIWVVSSVALRVVLLVIGMGVTLHIVSLRSLTPELLFDGCRTDRVDGEKSKGSAIHNNK